MIDSNKHYFIHKIKADEQLTRKIERCFEDSEKYFQKQSDILIGIVHIIFVRQ
jgi:hypothetical protein